jgi:hypothetical protein
MTIAGVGCGGDPAIPDGSVADATVMDVEGDTAIVDATRERVPQPIYDIVDGGTDGAKCVADQWVMRSCCNHTPCSGFCVRMVDGGVGCSCYGIYGGCPGTQDCCIGFRGCGGSTSCGPPMGK